MPLLARSQASIYVLPDQLGLLAAPQSRWRAFAGGFVFQLIVCTIVANIAFYEFAHVSPEEKYSLTELYAPAIPVESVAPKVRLDVSPPPSPLPATPEIVHKLSVPIPREATPEVAPAQRMALPQAAPDLALAKASRMPALKPDLRMNQFPGSSATPTLKLPASKVQTGGFGDPNGVPANPNAHGAVAIAQVGQFELPGGPGWGNGTGGSRGVRGTVVSAGFGNGIAGPGNGSGNTMPGGGVREGGFADAATVTTSAPLKPAAEKLPPLVPAQILSKPNPAYTAEARQKKIEGEVVLDVTLGADGRIRVLRVVSGLGYGLDEAAVDAAQRIQFKPATRNGQPIDSTARIRVKFLLA